MSILIIDRLIEMEESGNVDKALRQQFSILLSAVNDWPDPVVSIEQYSAGIEDFIDANPTQQQIEKWLKSCNVSENAWEAESLTALLELFQFYDAHISLNEIIKKMQTQIGD